MDEKRKLTEKYNISEKNQALLETILDSMLNPVFYKDKNAIYRGFNEIFQKQILGLSKEEILGRSLPELKEKIIHVFSDKYSAQDLKLLSENLERYQAKDLELLEEGGSSIHEHEVLCADGGKRVFLSTRTTYRDYDGQVAGLVSIMQDITGLRQVQEELLRSEERYRLITEKTGLLLYHCNYMENKIEVVGAILEVLGYDIGDSGVFSVEEWINLVHPDEREKVKRIYSQPLKAEGSFHTEYRMKRKDGTYFYAEDEGVVLKNEINKVYKTVGVIKDITKRKQVEETLVKIEEIRKKEIHHRIKNNLQVISSLLSLQANYFKDMKVIEAFKDSQSRVISMSLIHEELYESKHNKVLDFTAYLRKLTQELLNSYPVGNSRIDLEIDVNEEILLDMDTAIPLGMIINELVTNSLKHAFLKTSKGAIKVSFNSKKKISVNSVENAGNPGKISPVNKETCQFALVIADNGSGFPKNLDFENPETLGLQLINTLVEQIDGKIELNRDQGTEIKIEFQTQPLIE